MNENEFPGSEEAVSPILPPVTEPVPDIPEEIPSEADVTMDISREIDLISEIENAVSSSIAEEEQAQVKELEKAGLPAPSEPVMAVPPAPKPVEPPKPDVPEAPQEAALPEYPPIPEKPQQTPQAPARKGRPKRKKGEGLFGIPNILVTLVWVALTALIGVTAGRMVWICASDVLAFGRPDKTEIVTVYESDSIDEITEKLHKANLIKYPGLFKLYASFAVDEGEIHPGIWTLNTRYDYHALVRMMSPSSSREVIKVTIPEGYSCRQIFALLEENNVCTVKDIEAYAANGELNDYWFLEGVERGSKYSLEGFLFPDTYEFYKNDSPKNVLNKLLSNFDSRFDEELRNQIDLLNGRLADTMQANGRGADYINSHLFTIRDVVIVASLVEKETSGAKESYTIASVIYNRLFNWGKTPAFLNIDAAIVYALEGKTGLTAEDLRVDSPYNTYLNTGLTPGPISNPGLASLKAALDPADTNYYFYVLDPSVGSHHFSRTQEEHDAFRASLGG